MGVIQRQSLKHSAVNFVGLVVGSLSMLLVYPHALEAYGLVQYLLWVAIIGLPLYALGANILAIRFFPKFLDAATGHHGFLRLLLRLGLFGCLGSTLVVALGWNFVTDLLRQKELTEGKSPLLREYLWVAIPLTLCYVFSSILTIYSANFKRIVVPSLLFDFSPKIIYPALIFAYWQQWITLPMVLGGVLLHVFLVLVGLIFYLRWLGQWHLRPDPPFLGPALKREMRQFAAFGALTGLALLLASRVDVLMIGSLSSLTAAGVYAISVNLAAVIEIPTKSLYSASISSVARYVADDNRVELKDLYQRVSINLLVVGLLLFGALWISIDSLYLVLPNGAKVAAGKYALLFLGLAKLVDMCTGVNNYMIYYSKYYRYSLLSLSILAAVNIGLGFWLIPKIGLVGAALASFVSVVCYNAVSVGMVWQMFRLQPFSWRTVQSAGLALGVFTMVWWLPGTGWPLLDIVLRSGAYILLFGGLVLRFRLSPDFNGMLRKKVGKS